MYKLATPRIPDDSSGQAKALLVSLNILRIAHYVLSKHGDNSVVISSVPDTLSNISIDGEVTLNIGQEVAACVTAIDPTLTPEREGSVTKYIYRLYTCVGKVVDQIVPPLKYGEGALPLRVDFNRQPDAYEVLQSLGASYARPTTTR